METFSTLRIQQDGERTTARVDQLSLEDLGPGQVVIHAAYSSVNYMDALAGDLA